MRIRLSEPSGVFVQLFCTLGEKFSSLFHLNHVESEGCNKGKEWMNKVKESTWGDY